MVINGIIIFVMMVIIIFDIKKVESWKIYSDFEKGIVGLKANGESGFGSAGSRTVYTNELSFKGSQSCKITYQKGEDGFGPCRGEIGYPEDVGNGEELWISAMFYFQSPFSFSSAPCFKLLRIHVKNQDGSHAGYHSILGNSNGELELSNEIHSFQPDSEQMELVEDQWINLEMYVKLSPNNGILRVFKNGERVKFIGGGNEIWEFTGETLPNSYGLADFSYVMSYWNGGVVQNQSLFVDEFQITNEKPNKKDQFGERIIGIDSSPNWQLTPAHIVLIVVVPSIVILFVFVLFIVIVCIFILSKKKKKLGEETTKL